VKKLIDSSGEIHTYAELKPLSNTQHAGWYHFKVTSIYDAARNPTDEQTRFDMCLSPDSFKLFKELFDEMQNLS